MATEHAQKVSPGPDAARGCETGPQCAARVLAPLAGGRPKNHNTRDKRVDAIVQQKLFIQADMWPAGPRVASLGPTRTCAPISPAWLHRARREKNLIRRARVSLFISSAPALCVCFVTLAFLTTIHKRRVPRGRF